VIAEGVENEAELACIASMRCDLVQGYHFSRPMPAADVLDWLSNRVRVSA